MAWLEVALGLLKLANLLLGYVDREKARQAGRNEVILETTAQIAQKVATKKQIQEHIDGLTDDEVDAELRGLEP